MSHQWPAETVFRRMDLYLHDQTCTFCETNLHVCSHRRRRLFTLRGPWLLVVRLGHCPDSDCPGHQGTVSSSEEMAIAPPRLTVAWDALAWICHRRFARHWSVPQICAELSDSHAKVQMRRKVRGLRTIEQAVLREEAQKQGIPADSMAAVLPPELNRVASAATLAAERPTGEAVVEAVGMGSSSAAGRSAAEPFPAGQVVLDYCAVVRGILNDDQGGRLHPPGLRMANALKEVRASLGRNLEAKKGARREAAAAFSGMHRPRAGGGRGGSRRTAARGGEDPGRCQHARPCSRFARGPSPCV